ncbi:uncharacterized protein EI97DRAFT_440239 [Westerdykella ornata]|uniref:Uncharacterized protein n=1 Tax=Westerdykella ornata TaxID=318751 RepID=A0A6A6JPY3_WESOR|nr:uncharacterized protein EI97DRAFT_440239 [Westerdykella ornata]KAF2278710.1 hypothetical protein EI97DRAFT_440239 [Westerdykella ornata]
MVPQPIYRFIDSSRNVIEYDFDPSLRSENGDGPISLERKSRRATHSDLSSLLYPEPKAGDELFRYIAQDGAEVSYQYDPGSTNGKDYVVVVVRTPENWRKMMRREENLAYKGVGDWTPPVPVQASAGMGMPTAAGKGEKMPSGNRRDSAINVD